MKDIKRNSWLFVFSRRARCMLLLFPIFFVVNSCGYSMIGSQHLPFNSITINPVRNTTYEPGLEDRLHTALSKKFLDQGIKVMASGGDVVLDSNITTFFLSTIAAVDERVKEQELVLVVDMRLTDGRSVTEFPSVESPIRITFQATGSISDYIVHKERAIDKAFAEISREIVSRIIIRYVQ